MHFHQMKTKNIKVHYLNVDYVVTVRTDKINGGKGSIRNTFGDFPPAQVLLLNNSATDTLVPVSLPTGGRVFTENFPRSEILRS